MVLLKHADWPMEDLNRNIQQQKSELPNSLSGRDDAILCYRHENIKCRKK